MNFMLNCSLTGVFILICGLFEQRYDLLLIGAFWIIVGFCVIEAIHTVYYLVRSVCATSHFHQLQEENWDLSLASPMSYFDKIERLNFVARPWMAELQDILNHLVIVVCKPPKGCKMKGLAVVCRQNNKLYKTIVFTRYSPNSDALMARYLILHEVAHQMSECSLLGVLKRTRYIQGAMLVLPTFMVDSSQVSLMSGLILFCIFIFITYLYHYDENMANARALTMLSSLDGKRGVQTIFNHILKERKRDMKQILTQVSIHESYDPFVPTEEWSPVKTIAALNILFALSITVIAMHFDNMNSGLSLPWYMLVGIPAFSLVALLSLKSACASKMNRVVDEINKTPLWYYKKLHR